MPKYPELDQRILEWFTEQRSQGKFSVEQQKHDQINQLIAERMRVECVTQNYRVSCDNILCMKDCHWPVFTSVKTNSSHHQILTF